MEHRFRYLVERDADFAIIGAFEKNKTVRKLFLESFRNVNAKLLEVRHSYMQQEIGYGIGESDIIFIMEDDNGKFAIFIEDKIKANAQPNQAERYVVRANQLKDNKEFDDYRVFLCAPNRYLNQDSKNVAGYKYKVPYEAIVRLLPEGVEKSILEKAALSDSCTVADAGVTNFWKNLRTFINTYYSNKLIMKGKAEDKPSGSMWQEFKTDIPGCIIVMKINSRKIDLEFKGMGPRLDELNSILDNLGLQKAIRTNKGRSTSASIEIEINEENGMSFYSPFNEQESNAVVWIEKAMELMNIASILKSKNYNEFPLK